MLTVAIMASRLPELETIMRFAPAAAALSLLFAVTASVSSGAEREADPRAAILIAKGQAALKAGDAQAAVDSFEAALAIDPAHTPIILELAEAARREGLQGKAIRYYREALSRDPDNLAAISGEGEALVEKGALEKAKRNLAKLESMCGAACPETAQLQLSIRQGSQRRMAASEPAAPAQN